MAERLGEAILELRTNDQAFNAGITRAEGQAQKLGGTLDKASGSSSRLAGEMLRSGQSAEQMSKGFERAGQQVQQSSNSQRAAMQQLQFQINDVATMFALGANPMQIWASQGGQIMQILQQMAANSAQAGNAAGEASSDIEGMGDTVLETAEKAQGMGGKLGAVAGFLSGPWGIAINVALIALAPFIGKLFEGEEALQKVELASDNLGEAQTILGRVFDLTTGKLREQSAAAIETARTLQQLALLDAEKQKREAEAGLRESGARRVAIGTRQVRVDASGAPIAVNPTATIARTAPTVSAAAARKALAGDPEGALRDLRADLNAGRTTPEIYDQVSRQIINLMQGTQNIANANAGIESLDTGNLDPRFRRPGPRPARPSGPRERTLAERQADFDNQSFSAERDILQARLSLATSAQDRADLQRDLLAIERQQRFAAIEASDLSEEMKQSLRAQAEELYGREAIYDEQGNILVTFNRGLEGEIIARELAVRQLEQSQALAEIRIEGETEALQNALALADTEAERKAIALRLLEAEEQFERIRLQTIIDAAKFGEAEAEAAERAQAQLAKLNANAASRRAAVERQNETSLERYLRSVNLGSGQINEAIDGIQIDGLENLNDGLVRAIMGVESLGDVFSRVADQIIADLLRIAIQRAIIAPLANALFGAGSGDLLGSGGLIPSSGGGFSATLGGGGGLFGSIGKFFAGLFADGGTIPTGQFGIVGERGPEIAVATPGGLGIISNRNSRALLGGGASGPSINMPISIDATGADAAAIARLNARIEQLKDELPARIVTTVREARDRRFL